MVAIVDGETELRMEAMRADIRLKNEQARWEPWKFMVSAMTAIAALVAAVAGSIGYLIGTAHH